MDKESMEKSYHQKNKYHKVHRDGKILYTLKNMKETYQYPILAIDGGGTKTMAAIAEKTGTIKKSIIVGPSNYHVVGRRDVERSEEHTSELQSRGHLVCRLLL